MFRQFKTFAHSKTGSKWGLVKKKVVEEIKANKSGWDLVTALVQQMGVEELQSQLADIDTLNDKSEDLAPLRQRAKTNWGAQFEKRQTMLSLSDVIPEEDEEQRSATPDTPRTQLSPTQLSGVKLGIMAFDECCEDVVELVELAKTEGEQGMEALVFGGTKSRRPSLGTSTFRPVMEAIRGIQTGKGDDLDLIAALAKVLDDYKDKGSVESAPARFDEMKAELVRIRSEGGKHKTDQCKDTVIMFCRQMVARVQLTTQVISSQITAVNQLAAKPETVVKLFSPPSSEMFERVISLVEDDQVPKSLRDKALLALQKVAQTMGDGNGVEKLIENGVLKKPGTQGYSKQPGLTLNYFLTAYHTVTAKLRKQSIPPAEANGDALEMCTQKGQRAIELCTAVKGLQVAICDLVPEHPDPVKVAVFHDLLGHCHDYDLLSLAAEKVNVHFLLNAVKAVMKEQVAKEKPETFLRGSEPSIYLAALYLDKASGGKFHSIANMIADTIVTKVTDLPPQAPSAMPDMVAINRIAQEVLVASMDWFKWDPSTAPRSLTNFMEFIAKTVRENEAVMAPNTHFADAVLVAQDQLMIFRCIAKVVSDRIDPSLFAQKEQFPIAQQVAAIVMASFSLQILTPTSDSPNAHAFKRHPLLDRFLDQSSNRDGSHPRRDRMKEHFRTCSGTGSCQEKISSDPTGASFHSSYYDVYSEMYAAFQQTQHDAGKTPLQRELEQKFTTKEDKD